MILFIFSVCLALGVSFFCSLMEATLLSLTPSQIADLSVKQPKLGLIWQGFKNRIERPIAVILLINTAAHTVGATLAGSQADDIFGKQWIWVFSLGFTFAMLQFTEILPKTLGVRLNQELAYVMARPLSLAVVLFSPLIRVLHWINRPFEFRRGTSRPRATVDEISALAGMAQLSKQINPQQAQIIQTTARLSSLKARQVMIPVDHISFLSTSQKIVDAVLAAHQDAHTRYPVCENQDPNRVVGYVNFKEMIYFMRTNPHEPSLLGIIRPIHSVGPDESVAALLKRFVAEHIHIALVKDDSGKTLGLVTLEDLMEELVGEIEDEFDRLPKMIHSLGQGNTLMVGGGAWLSDLITRTHLPAEESQETVAAWVVRQLGHAPKPGDTFVSGEFECMVRRVRRGKVFEIALMKKLHRKPDA